MSAKVKKWFNRVGLGLVGVGIIGVVVAGGDPGPVLETASTIAQIAGTVVIIIREIAN